MIGYIYWIHSLLDNKKYIGSTYRVYREKEHWDMLENGKKGLLKKNGKKDIHHSSHLQYAYNKYGKDNFIFNIIDAFNYTSEEELKIREQEYIDLYHTLNNKYGYNCKPAYRNLMKETNPNNWKNMKKKMSDSKKGKKPSKETLKKMSISHTGLKQSADTIAKRFKNPPTKEQIAKTVAFHTGRKRSEETKAKISAATKGKSRNKGKLFSEEHKAKIGTALRGKKRTPFSDEHRAKMSLSGKGKHFTSAETKAKMSIAAKNRIRTPLSKETIVKIVTFHTGRKRSEVTRKKISEAGKGRKHSAETKLKMSLAHKRRWAIKNTNMINNSIDQL
jgi:group I intron endonuclease